MIGRKQIGFVVADLSLKNARDALQTHARIDRRLGKRSEMALCIAIELHEDEVPDLDIPAAFARKSAVRVAQFAGCRAEVVMDLRTGTAGSGFAHLPEVVFFVEADDAISRNATFRSARVLRPRRLHEKQ